MASNNSKVMAEEETEVCIVKRMSELRFAGPSAGSPVTSYFNVTNLTSQQIHFKMQTTAPESSCVRPEKGILKAYETYEIAVFMDVTPCLFTVTIQSLILPEGATDDQVKKKWKDPTSEKFECDLKFEFQHPLIKPGVDKKTKLNVKNVSKSTIGKGKVTGDELEISSKQIDKNEEKLVSPKQEVVVSISTKGEGKVTGDSLEKSSKPIDEKEKKLLSVKEEVVNSLEVEESSLRQENLPLKVPDYKMFPEEFEMEKFDHDSSPKRLVIDEDRCE